MQDDFRADSAAEPPAADRGAPRPLRVAVIGGGPAGLMAAEVLALDARAELAAAGWSVEVDVFDAMPSVGRKFLLAGRGGLNLTHGEPLDRFLTRYGRRCDDLAPSLLDFDPLALREWARGLGIETFIGTSGRVFPTDMKAAPLLRAWLHRLRAAGVRFHARHRWLGWDDADGSPGPGGLRFAVGRGDEAGEQTHRGFDAVVLALGGASWPQLGSTGAWTAELQRCGVQVEPLRPSNCGFDVAPTAPGRSGWSDLLRQRWAGEPVKPVVASFTDAEGRTLTQQGEFVLTATGVEGSLIYAFSSRLREAIELQGQATLVLDLLPAHSHEQVLAEVGRPRGTRSLSTHLKSRLNVSGIKLALLHEALDATQRADPVQLARALKAWPLRLAAPRPIDEAISTAGGVAFEALDAHGMLRARPGVFCAGEMLDWEAPTGGYLLTACLATGRAAGRGLARWWLKPPPR